MALYQFQPRGSPSAMQVSPYHNEEYTVGWICAKTIEMTAARTMFDKIHGRPRDAQSAEDPNTYLLGESHGHKIAMTILPANKNAGGNVPASQTAMSLSTTFTNVKLCLMVGIGGAIPGPEPENPFPDIRLGDVVVAVPDGTISGVVEYDKGKMLVDGEVEPTGSLDSPSQLLRGAINNLGSDTARYGRLFEDVIAPKLTEEAWSHFQPPADADTLFQFDYNHNQYAPNYIHLPKHEKNICRKICDPNRAVKRNPRLRDAAHNPCIHQGIIASGNMVIKNPVYRDLLRKKYNALCVDMESAGMMNINKIKCMVVRGISDYCDTHKNDLWQPYAALTAAAFATELLRVTAVPKDLKSPAGSKKRASRSTSYRYSGNSDSGSSYDARSMVSNSASSAINRSSDANDYSYGSKANPRSVNDHSPHSSFSLELSLEDSGDINPNKSNGYETFTGDPLFVDSRGRSSSRFQRARVRFESPTRTGYHGSQFPGSQISLPGPNHRGWNIGRRDDEVQSVASETPLQKPYGIHRAGSVGYANQTFNQTYGPALEQNEPMVSQVLNRHPENLLHSSSTASHRSTTPPTPPPSLVASERSAASHRTSRTPAPSTPSVLGSYPSPPLSFQTPNPPRPALRRSRTPAAEEMPEQYYRNHTQTTSDDGNNTSESSSSLQPPQHTTHEQEDSLQPEINHIPLTIQEDPSITIWNPASPFLYQRMSKRKLSPRELEVLHSRVTTILLERTFGSVTVFLHLSIPTTELVSAYKPHLPGEAPPGIRLARSMVYTREIVDARAIVEGATVRPKENEFFYSRAQIGDDRENPTFVRILFKRSVQAVSDEDPYLEGSSVASYSNPSMRGYNNVDRSRASRTVAVMSGIWIVEFNRSILTESKPRFRFGTGEEVLRAFYSFNLCGETRTEDDRHFLTFEGVALTTAYDEDESRLIPKQLRLRVLKDNFDGRGSPYRNDHDVQLVQDFAYRGARKSVVVGSYEVRFGRSAGGHSSTQAIDNDYSRDGDQRARGAGLVRARLVFEGIASFCKVGVRFGDVRRRYEESGRTVVTVGMEEIWI